MKPAAKPAPAKPAAKPAPAKPAPVKTAPGKPVAKAPAAKTPPVKAAPAKAAPAPAAKTNGVKTNGKAAPVPAKTSAPAAKAAAAAPAAKTNGKVAPPPAKGASKPETKPETKPAPKVDAKAADPKSKGKDAKGKDAKIKDKSKEKDPNDTPYVPKKGPIDVSQHKSVAEAAAAVAIARGSTGEFMIINGRRVRAISTKGITVAKKSKTAAAEVAVAPNEQQIREIKTKLTKKELDEYRALLLTKRRQLFGMLSGMEDEALRSSGGNLSNMPVHMADMGSDVYDQDFTLGMAETERAILAEIDAALQRIEDKTFGVCQMTGKPISKARLDAKPWAKYTIEAERIAESSGSR